MYKYLNVKENFGAKGDGVTDDTAAIQAALNAASGTTTYATSVYIPAGTYKITGITLPSYIRVDGANRDSTIILYTGSGIALQKNNASITHGVMLSNLTIRGTDGNGGTGLKLDTFRRGIFSDITIDMFRNAGNTGVGILFDNQYGNCAFNHFTNLEISNCDDAFVMDGSNGSHSTGYNHFDATRILTEVRGMRLLNTVADASKYNVFNGVTFQNSGSTTHCLEIAGSSNLFNGVVIDGSPTTKVLSFDKTTTAGNRIQFLLGFDVSKYSNAWTTGTPNTVITDSSFVGSPGKPLTFTDVSGALDVRFTSGGTNQALELQLGNSSSTQQWRLIQQASSSPYISLNYGSTLSQRWDRSGNVGIGSTAISAGGGSGVIYVANSPKTPTSNPSGGSLLFSSNGELKTLSVSGYEYTIGASPQVINVKQFGAKGDGVTDDTLAISGAISVANNNVVFMPPGTYIVSSMLAFDRDMTLYGDNATIRTTGSGIGMSFSGDVVIDGITFDANNNTITERMLNMAGASTDKFVVRNCNFKNMKSNTYAYGVNIGLCDTFRIDNCNFDNIKCLANGVVGDSNGAVRAILMSYTCKKGIINECTFNNIHNVTSSGTFAFEDADAIQFSVGGGTTQHIDVSNCQFSDTGKRFIKVQGSTGSRYTISNCMMSSSYVGTPDDNVTNYNGMFCAIEVFAGQTLINNVQFLGGVCGYFVQASTSAVDGLEVINCVYHPEYHRYSLTAQTAFAYIASNTNNNAKLLFCNNNVKNTWLGINKLNGSALLINGNTFGTQHHCITAGGSGISNCSNNSLYFLAASSAIDNPYTYYFPSGATNGVFCGNIVEGFADGVYIAQQPEPPTYKLVVTDNIFNNLTRNIFSNFYGARSPYVYFDNNLPNTIVYTNKAGKVHTYSTAAPTTGSGYVGDIVWNTAPSAGSYIGWVCTTSGAPGTWKTFGPITA